MNTESFDHESLAAWMKALQARLSCQGARWQQPTLRRAAPSKVSPPGGQRPAQAVERGGIHVSLRAVARCVIAP